MHFDNQQAKMTQTKTSADQKTQQQGHMTHICDVSLGHDECFLWEHICTFNNFNRPTAIALCSHEQINDLQCQDLNDNNTLKKVKNAVGGVPVINKLTSLKNGYNIRLVSVQNYTVVFI